jgi:hypothetical protein
MKDALLQGDAVKDALLQGDAVKDTLLQGDVVKDALLQGDAVKDTLLQGDAVKDPLVQSVVVEDELVKYEHVKDCAALAALHVRLKTGRFLDLDDEKVRNALADGKRKSRHSEVWACNAFDEWRIYNGYSVEKSIADLSEEKDIRSFVDLLFKFKLQVRKSDGSLYPPSSYVLHL